MSADPTPSQDDGSADAEPVPARNSDTLVFIPAWNEEENLPGVLQELDQQLPSVDVLVVDDGSTDGTSAFARTHGARVSRSTRTAACAP